ncbi:MAG: hypothetical protein RJB13_362 [Pseudomonadota bacterium]
MKKTNLASLTLLSALAALSLTVACDGHRSSPDSQVQFLRSNESKAYLEQRDLTDTFLFGLNVIETQDFFDNALNLNFRPVESKLVLINIDKPGTQLVVATDGPTGLEKLLAFDAIQLPDGRVEVDFSSAGNDISLWNGIGGATIDYEAGRDAGSWQTVDAPRVVQVVQDPDTVIVDIIHKVSFTLAKEPANGDQSKTGQIKIRLFLKRQVKDPRLTDRTVERARAQNIGFFPASRSAQASENSPIAHYKIDTDNRVSGQKIIYLKDFPNEYEDVGRASIESWNIAFGFDAFKTEIADEGIDLGDPRYNVVKWIDNLDNSVPWAGYAPTMVNPLTGEVISTQILINGNTTQKTFEEIYKYTSEVAPKFSNLTGKIGNVPLIEGAGENPVISFFADAQSTSADEYVKGYYYSVIMHEFGHSLGLRHNFAGSTQIDADGISSSVMDYEPGFITNIRRVPGSYDVAAIRWGYLNENPQTSLIFCTDEDLEKRLDCNQGDLGNPADYVVTSLIQGTTVLENLTTPLPSFVKKPMKSTIKTAYKIIDKQSQLSEDKRATQIAQIRSALNRVKNARPAEGLAELDRSIVKANLAKLSAAYEDASKPKAQSPIALGRNLSAHHGK